MNSNIEKFLLNPDENDKIFRGNYHSKKFHKEKYDDRFVVIYMKIDKENYLEQNDYEVVGYLDIKDKCIYNHGYNMDEFLPKEKSLLERGSFNLLNKKMFEEIKNYIEKYSFDNEENLKEIAIEKYNHIDEWGIERYKKEVREQFIAEENPIIKLEKSYTDYAVTNSDEYCGKTIYIEYLDNPERTVKKYANKIIESLENYKNNKEELGLELLIYRDKIDYLNQIIANENHKFDDLYINKLMYNSIKDLDAKTLNITIKYGENTYTFKYDYDILKRDLLNDDRSSNSWGIAYDKVSDFIKENTNKEDYRSTEEFLFSNVTSITYGKKELYHYSPISNEIALEEEYELER